MPVEVTVNQSKFYNQYKNDESYGSNLTDFTNNLACSVMEKMRVKYYISVASYFLETVSTRCVYTDLGGNLYRIQKQTGSFSDDGFGVGDSLTLKDTATVNAINGVVEIVSSTYMQVQLTAAGTVPDLTTDTLIANTTIPAAVI